MAGIATFITDNRSITSSTTFPVVTFSARAVTFTAVTFIARAVTFTAVAAAFAAVADSPGQFCYYFVMHSVPRKTNTPVLHHHQQHNNS